jgi:hypothetical protein
MGNQGSRTSSHPDIQYSDAAWRTYVLERVEANNEKQLERLGRLIDEHQPDAWLAWRNLARDVRPLRFLSSDGKPYEIPWNEALHQVIGTLIFPPGIHVRPKQRDYKRAATAVEKLKQALREAQMPWFPMLDQIAAEAKNHIDGLACEPLMPGKAGEHTERNWLTLYLRERVIRPFFIGAHHEDIARLVNVTLEIDSMTADSVRLLKPRNLKQP